MAGNLNAIFNLAGTMQSEALLASKSGSILDCIAVGERA